MSKENIFLCLGTIFVSAFLVDGDRLSVIEDCQWKYPLKSDSGVLVGNVTVTDIGTECPVGLHSRHTLITTEPDYYTLKVKADINTRQIYLSWDHDVCSSVYFIQFQAIFEPRWVLHNESKKCVKIEIQPLNQSNIFHRAAIHFNCLRLPDNVSGTLKIKNWRFPSRHGKHCLPNNVDRAYHEKTFNLGCPINRNKVQFIGPCLKLEFLGLHRHVSYNVMLNNLYNFSGNDIIRFVEQEGTLDLPIYKNEDNVIKITIVCDSYGEIYERVIILNRSVNEKCSKYIPTSTTTSTTGIIEQPTQLDNGVVYIAITVFLVIGTVVVIVTGIFVKTRIARDGSGQSCNFFKYDRELNQNSIPPVRMSMLLTGELSCIKSEISPVVDSYSETQQQEYSKEGKQET